MSEEIVLVTSMKMNAKPSFTVVYRGLYAIVEPADAPGNRNGCRWEYRFDPDDSTGGWQSLGIGTWPEATVEDARARAVELCRINHPAFLAVLYRQRERLEKRIKELEAE